MAARILEVILRAKDEASAVIGKAEGNIASSTSKIAGLVKGLAATAAAAAVGKFFADSAKSAMDAERSMAGLSAVLQPLGINYDKIKGSTEAYLTTLQRTTRFGDDEYRDTLARMVVRTNDLNGSQAMLASVAGVAINKQIDLASAGDIVAKAMNGNAKALEQLGLKGTPVNEVMDKIREKFQIIAEQDGKTFSGRLEQLKNGWDDFKEAVGFAIIGSNDMTDAAGGLVGMLGRLADFVQDNQAFIGSFIKVVFALGEAVWSIVRVPLKALVTALLMVNDAVSFVMFAFGSLVEKGGKLLSKFGIDVVENMGVSLREAGEAMAKLSKTGYDALWGETKKGEQRITALVADGVNDRGELTEDEINDRLAKEKVFQKERAKIAEDIAVYALAIEQGLTEKQAREQVRRQQMLGTYVAVEFSTLERGYERRDALQQKYEQGWTRHLQRVIDASTTASAKVVDSTTRMIEPYKGLDKQLSDIAAVATGAQANLNGLSEAQQEAADKAATFRDELRTGVTAATGFASGLGLISDAAANVVSQLVNIGANIGKALSGDVTSIAGVLGGLTGILGTIFGGDKERAALVRKNTDALRDLTTSVGDFARVSAPGAKVLNIQSFLGGFLADLGKIDARKNPFRPGEAGFAEFERMQGSQRADLFKSFNARALKAGLSAADIDQLAKDLGIDIRDSKGNVVGAGLKQLFEGLANIEPGFANTYADQIKRITTGLGIGAITQGQEFGQLLSAIGAGGENAITKALAGADFSTMEGRSSAAGSLRALFNNIGNLSLSDFGGLNQADFLDALDRLIGILTDPERLIDAVATGTPSMPGMDLSTAFGDLTVSFEDIGTQQIDYLASIDMGITGLLERWTDIDTGRAVQATQLAITVGEVNVQTAATDAAGTGEAVQAAVTAAINQALADAYLDRQLATGNVTRTVT